MANPLPNDIADAPDAPAPDQESYSLMEDEVSATPTAGMKTDSVNIRPAKNGGFIASCSKSAPSSGPGNSVGSSYESNDYAFTSIDELHRFIDQEFGGGAPAPGVAPLVAGGPR